MNKVNTVVIIPEVPGDFGGYKVAIKSMLKVYEKLFGQLLIFVCDEEKNSTFEFLELSHQIEYLGQAKSPKFLRFALSLLYGIPATSMKYHYAIKKALNFMKAKKINPNFLVFEDVQLAYSITEFRNRFPKAKFVVRSHDIMSLAYKALKETNYSIVKRFWKIELQKITRSECLAYHSSDFFIPISVDDNLSYQAEFGVTKASRHPVSVAFDTSRYSEVCPGDINKVICVGAFDIRKSRGLKRFIIEAWPLVLKLNPNAELVIAGKGSEDFSDSGSNIVGLGWVADDRSVLSMGNIFINTQDEGSGVQIKSLIAFASGKKLISLPLGLTGIDHRISRFATECFNYKEMGEAIVEHMQGGIERSNDQRICVSSHNYDVFVEVEASRLREHLLTKND